MQKKRLRLPALLSLGALLACLSGCAPARNAAVGYYFDTAVTLTGYCPEQVLREALAECARYEALLSKTRAGSDVWRLNHSAGEAVEVSADTLAVLALAQEVAQRSGGAFDVTIAPVSALWDFKAAEPTLPPREALQAAAARVDYTQITLEGGRARLGPGQSIDLGGVAKGYVADALAGFLTDRGVKSALVNLGGNVKALGAKPRRVPWQVAIQDPAGEPGASLAKLPLGENGSLVTSGVYERGFNLGGVRYHHILDPATGYPVQNGILSVTILAQSSMLADALSTACFVLGVEKGKALAADYGAEALFVLDTDEMVSTEGMEALLNIG